MLYLCHNSKTLLPKITGVYYENYNTKRKQHRRTWFTMAVKNVLNHSLQEENCTLVGFTITNGLSLLWQYIIWGLMDTLQPLTKIS